MKEITARVIRDDIRGKVNRLKELAGSCTLCPRRCGVNRWTGQLGVCGLGARAVVASAGPHFGEEPVLVGRGGSGTIFLSRCNLQCVYCQNYTISQIGEGKQVEPAELAQLATALAEEGCENINFVTPTPVAHAVAEAIALMRQEGLTLPTVYNCGGYEAVEVLSILDGLIDIYMPDFKYGRSENGQRYSGVENYPEVAEKALTEMFRQVGPLLLNAAGQAVRGVLVRHLVLPGGEQESRLVMEKVAAAAPGCTINVMGQYRPCYRAREYPELLDYPTRQMVDRLRHYAQQLGLITISE